MKIEIRTPLTKEVTQSLKAGDLVELTGTVYTARDAAHKRLHQAILDGQDLPFDISDQIIYYVGPTPAKEGEVIGSAGPTTSGRMDAYSPLLMQNGLKGMIGKGLRNKEVIEAIKEHKAIYFGATGGAGALLANHIKSCEIIAYDDLGTEAIRKLEVEKFPLIVIIDTEGNNQYDIKS